MKGGPSPESPQMDLLQLGQAELPTPPRGKQSRPHVGAQDWQRPSELVLERALLKTSSDLDLQHPTPQQAREEGQGLQVQGEEEVEARPVAPKLPAVGSE